MKSLARTSVRSNNEAWPQKRKEWLKRKMFLETDPRAQRSLEAGEAKMLGSGIGE